MKHLCNEDGFIKPLFYLAVLGFLIYAGFQFGTPYLRYSTFKSDVKEITRVGLGNVEKIRTEVFEAAEHYKIPIEEKDIIVSKNKDEVRVQTSWSADVDILGIYQKRLDFEIDIEE